MSPLLTVILVDVRSAHNVGAIMRTADAVGAQAWTVGITPHPPVGNDPRPPHVADRALAGIRKTALGAEATVGHQHFATFEAAVASRPDAQIIALEQAPDSCDLFKLENLNTPRLLVVGSETDGLSAPVLAACNTIAEIPMRGRKESLNVAVAAGIALYQLRG